MSRSYRKFGVTPWTTSESEKDDKIIANRIFRRRVKQALKKGRISRLPYKMREVSEIFDWGKDGRCAHSYLTSRSLVTRKNNEELHKWYRRK